MVIFGEGLEPATTTESAVWIQPACGGEPWTVGQLVPNHYESYLRLIAPPGGTEAWWSEYCDLFRAVASVAEHHTTTPDHAWFAIWEGHGFASPSGVPVFDLPNRSYFLLQGSVMAAAAVKYPDVEGWRNPDLIWPEDQSWFIATDVDFWSLYLGGTNAFATELAEHFAANARQANVDDHLVTEA